MSVTRAGSSTFRIHEGSVIVVTGAASGIGLGLARAAAARGAKLVLADVRDAALEAAIVSLRTEGADALAVVTDVGDARSVEALADAAFDRFGQVDLLCNNAGLVSPAVPLWEQDIDTWNRMVRVKLMGTVNGVRSFVPRMLEQSHGHVLNTASSGGLAPLPMRTPYTTTMHAVVGLTETLNAELRAAKRGFGATVLCPGLVDTDLGRNSAELGAVDAPTGTISDLGLSALTPDEVAQSALAAIEAGLVHVAPGAGVLDRALARVQALLSDLEAPAGRIA
jgi:NAD(P)-dependent dehydrogenase (short-subunit alcohol dehydrogenase family)